MSEKQESLFEFPCEFPIKAMGLAEPGFDALIVSIVARHGASFHEGAVTTRASRNGKYLAVTVTIQAESREQLDAIYLDLTAHEKVIMSL